MKVIKEEKYIPAKTYTETKYIASDGREFFNEKDCIRHEEHLEVLKHPVYATSIETCTYYDGDYAKLYYISCEEDYDFLIATQGVGLYFDSDFEQYGAGWYLRYEIDMGDYPSHAYLWNYDNYVKEAETTFENWKSNNKKKMQQINL